jgi:hypothetical protein
MLRAKPRQTSRPTVVPAGTPTTTARRATVVVWHKTQKAT